jgi:iron complex outermembrane receptor protein
MYDAADGFFHNRAVPLTSTGARTPDHDRVTPANHYIVRGTALWEPSDVFNARFKVALSQDHIYMPGASQIVSCPGGIIAPLGTPFMGGGEDCKLDRTIHVVSMDPAAYPALQNNGESALRIAQKFGTVELNWHVRPDITVTSVTGYYHVRSGIIQNSTNTNYAAAPLVVQTRFHRTDVTQELRANTSFSGPFNVTVGGFYEGGHFDVLAAGAGNILERLPAQLTRYAIGVDIDSFSAFGQLRWTPLPKFEVAVGTRWTDEKRKESAVNMITGTPVSIAFAAPRIESKNFQPELTVSYYASDDVTLFGSLKKGNKSGSFNLGQVPANGLDNSYGDETIKGGDFGVKSRLLDRRLALDVAFFSYRYTGLQVGVNLPAANGVPQNRTINAGSAKTYGIDFSSSYRPPEIEGLTLNLAGQWDKAKFTTLTNVPCYGGQTIALGCTLTRNPNTQLFTAQDLSGIPLLRAPEWQLSFGLSYEWSLNDGKTLIFSNDNAYLSRYLLILGKRPDFYQPGYIKSDLSVTLRAANNHWELALITKNVGNKLTMSGCANFNAAGSILGGQINGGTTSGAAGVDAVGCRVDPGRELWLRLTVRPFG